MSKTRQTIERAFALLKGRFRRLKFLDMTKTDCIPSFILACCVLHNICLRNLGEEDIEEYIQEGYDEDNDNENNPDNDDNNLDNNENNNRNLGINQNNFDNRNAGLAKRNDLVQIVNQ